ncbi:transposase [Streptomyces sioyaensis]|uniref:transposase n=1 Tax=Streptomyces sioyaensis TaxID=67364 RepID=UPI003711AB00
MAAPRKFPDELRERATREARTTSRPIAHGAKDLGIHKEALRGWVRQAEADRGERDHRLTTAEREELTTRPLPPTKPRSVSRRSCSGQDPFEDGP